MPIVRWLLFIAIVFVCAVTIYNRVSNSSPASKSSTPAYNSSASVGTPPNKQNELNLAAERSGVRIASFTPKLGGADVSVEWSSDNAAQGGDFLAEAVKSGAIRDFKETAGFRESRVNGRRVFAADYQVKY